jgi:glycosyltransferase involved in cell wall biosynthesis
MNVLFLTISYPRLPENPNMYGDLALEFRRGGHSIHVVTVLESKAGKDTQLEEEAGIPVLRVKCGGMFGVGFARKGLSTLAMPGHMVRAIKRNFPGIRFDLVFCTTPHITFYRVLRYLKNAHGCPAYLILRDIFPQNARDLGALKSSLLFRWFRGMEAQLYEVSDRIGCMSQGNMEYIQGHNPAARHKCELLPHWKTVGAVNPQPAKDYHSVYGLGGRFTAVFCGVMGIAQDLDFLLELAWSYRDDDSVRFLLVGEGTEKERLKLSARERGLSNVIIGDKIASGDLAALLTQCDVGLVNLNRSFSIPNIPSKTLDYFEARLPVLAAIDPSTDYGHLLDDAGAGFWSITGDLETYRRNLERLRQDPGLRRRMGESGRTYLETRMSTKQAYETVASCGRPS